jgi:hypothetical protein
VTNVSDAQSSPPGSEPDAVPSPSPPAPAPAEPDRRLEIVLSEALRALAHQQALLDNLRSRATLLTTAAALVASFPGVAAATGRLRLSAPAVVAPAALAGVLICCLVVCAPWWRWQFRTSATALLRAVDDGHDVDSIRRHLARDFEQWLDRNDQKIRILQWWFTAGLLLLAIEVAAWAVQLGAGLK